MEVDALADLPVRLKRMISNPVLHFENGFAKMGLALRIAVLQFAAHHALDDPILADLGSVKRLDRRAVPAES